MYTGMRENKVRKDFDDLLPNFPIEKDQTSICEHGSIKGGN